MRGFGLSGLVASITLGLSVAVACGGSTEHNTSTSGGRDSVGTGGRATGGMRSTTGGTSVGTGGTVDLGELDDDDAVTDPNTITGGNGSRLLRQIGDQDDEREDRETADGGRNRHPRTGRRGSVCGITHGA